LPTGSGQRRCFAGTTAVRDTAASDATASDAIAANCQAKGKPFSAAGAPGIGCNIKQTKSRQAPAETAAVAGKHARYDDQDRDRIRQKEDRQALCPPGSPRRRSTPGVKRAKLCAGKIIAPGRGTALH